MRLRDVDLRARGDEVEALLVVVRGLLVGVLGARDVGGGEVRLGGEGLLAGRLAVPGEHAERLLVRADVLLGREPVGDGRVVTPAGAGRRELEERLALEVVLEDVLLVVGEGAVGQAKDVVALA